MRLSTCLNMLRGCKTKIGLYLYAKHNLEIIMMQSKPFVLQLCEWLKIIIIVGVQQYISTCLLELKHASHQCFNSPLTDAMKIDSTAFNPENLEALSHLKYA